MVAKNQNARFAYNYLREKYGYSPAQAAGLVGNLMAESSLNTGAVNPKDGRDGSDSIGIAQWNGKRATGLRSFAADSGRDVYGLDTQLDYLVHEMNGVEKRAGNLLRNANDITSATRAGISFERPAGFSWDNPSNGLHYDKRENYAYQIAKEFGGDDASQIVASYKPTARASAMPAQTSQAQPQTASTADPRRLDDQGKELTGAKGFGRDIRNGIDDFLGVTKNDDGNRELWGFTLDGKNSDIGNIGGFLSAFNSGQSEPTVQPLQGGRLQGSSQPIELQFASSLVNNDDDPRKRRGGLPGFGGFRI